MSNFDYHIGYIPMTRQQYRATLLKRWFLRIVKIVILILLMYFIYRTFIYNPYPNFKARGNDAIEIIALNEDGRDFSQEENHNQEINSDKKINKKESSFLQESPNLPKKIAPTTPDIDKTSITMTDSSKENMNSISAKPNHAIKQKDVNDNIEKNISDKDLGLQNNQAIINIINQIEIDRTNKSNSNNLIKTNETLVKNTISVGKIKVTTKPYQISDDQSNSLINQLNNKENRVPSSKITAEALEDIDDIQKRYEQDLNRLSSEAELENLLKSRFSKYLGN